MAHIGTASWVRNTVWVGLGLAALITLVVWAYSLSATNDVPVAGPSTSMILLTFGILFGVAEVLSTILKKPEIGKAAWQALWIGGALAVLAWFVWGAGWDAVGPHIGAAPTFKPKLMVELRGACVDIAQRLPARGIINWDTRRVVNPEAIFSDGSKLPLRGDVKDRGNIRAVCGEGVLAASW